MNTTEKLGIKAKGQEAVETDGRYQLREPVLSYKANFTPENNDLRPENKYFWNDIALKSIR